MILSGLNIVILTWDCVDDYTKMTGLASAI